MQIDASIWIRISQEDRDAYAVMYRDYFRRFYNYGKKFVTDDVLIEDAAQETLLLIWDKRATIPDLRFPRTYFYTTFRNILITRIRQQKADQLPDMQTEEPGFNAEQLIVLEETDQQVKMKLGQAIQALTPRQREAIYLRFYEGLSFEEVASILNITTKSTYKIISRALASLKEIMIYPALILLVLFSEIISL